MLPIMLSKNLRAASSNGITTFSSQGITTLNTSDLGTARRLIVWGTSNANTSFVITGLNETFETITETVTGSTGTATVSTVQDFRSVTSIAPSANVGSSTNSVSVGTNTQGGTPWQVIDMTRNPINFAFNLTPSSTAIVASLEYSMDYPVYDPINRVWPDSANVNSGPAPVISTAASSVSAATQGVISTPIAAWRVTLTSSSSGAGTAFVVGTQAG